MTSDDVTGLLRAEPFIPFRLRLNSDAFHDVPHPEMAIVSDDVVALSAGGRGRSEAKPPANLHSGVRLLNAVYAADTWTTPTMDLRLLLAFALMLGSSLRPVVAQAIEPTTREDCESECIRLLDTIEASRRSGKVSDEGLLAMRGRLAEWSEVHPESPLIRFTAGMACMLGEDAVGALPHLKSAYENSQHNVTMGSTYALALKIAKQPEASLAVAATLARENPRNQSLRYSYALRLKMMQQYELAIAQFQPFLEKTGDALNRASAIGNIGECKLYLGEHEEAIGLLLEAHDGNPDGRALANLAEAYVKTRQFGKAKDAIRELLDMTKNHPRTLFLTAVILESEGHAKRAETYYTKAYHVAAGSLVEDSGSENYLLYQICEKLGKDAEALAYKSDAKKLHFTYEAPWGEVDQ